MVASPLRQRLGLDVLVPVCLGPLLDKHNVGSVVGKLGKDVAAARPRGDNVSRGAPACLSAVIHERCAQRTWSDGHVAKLVVRVLDPFAGGVFGGHKRHDVVCPTSLLYDC